MKKKVILISLFFTTMLLGGCSLFGTEGKIEKDIEKKFGDEVELEIVREFDTCDMFESGYVMQVKGKPNFQFEVIMNHNWIRPDEIISNDYEKGKKEYKEFKKIEKSIPEINKLGFKKAEYRNYIEVSIFDDKEDIGLILEAKNINLRNNDVEGYEKILKLVQITKKSKADIHKITLLDLKDTYVLMDIKLKDEEITNIDELKDVINKYNDEYASLEKAKEIKPIFDGISGGKIKYEKDMNDGKLFDEPRVECVQDNDESTYCDSYRFFFTYEKDGLNIAYNDEPLLEILALIEYINKNIDDEYSIFIQEDREDKHIGMIIENARDYKDIETLKNDILLSEPGLKEYKGE